MPYTVAIAGTTENTVAAARALLEDKRFELTAVLTPKPKPIGRKQIVTKNPLHLFAEENEISISLVSKNIDSGILEAFKSSSSKPDFLLVVDFGYIIPSELLNWPEIAPLNIHPSLLPRWRGSSPGQFAILFGDKKSAITLMVMNERLDQGPILAQHEFTIQPDWTQEEYYQYSFELIAASLADDITDFAEGRITPEPQELKTPTPIAGRLSKEDSFIEWKTLSALIKPGEAEKLQFSSPLLQEAAGSHASYAAMVHHAVRAFTPWPQVWTKIPTPKGEKRMKIIKTDLVKSDSGDILELEDVHIEGQQPAKWHQVKNILE